MDGAALALRGVTKRFGSVTALDGATLEVAPGTVHALLGENGAGKTTLMRIAFGMLRPDSGTVSIRGESVRLATPSAAIARGVGMVHQHFTNVHAMTVAENVALGGTGLYDRARARDRVREIGDATGLVLDPDALVQSLSVGAQQRLEIVKALARDATTLILDEPTAVLAPGEAAELLRWVKAFARGGSGRAAILITHKLREAATAADDVTVLRAGRTVLHERTASLTEGRLVEALLGVSQHDPLVDSATRQAGDVVLALLGVGLTDQQGVARLRDVTLEIRSGEIVGIAAVEGSGQRELLRVLAGRLAPTTGQAMIAQSVGFVPEDRHRDALVLSMALDENVALRNAGARRGIVQWKSIRERATRLVRDHDVRAPSLDTHAAALSGGNQQKLVLARELDGSPRALVVENPTRGLDIRATEAVHSRLRAARSAGLAVVLHSGDLDEVLALADRVIVMHAGRAIEATHDRDLVGRLMLTGDGR